jgi:3-methyladenine DNA glycosylase/8-oxoguanine DNA glycosylase
MTEPFKSALDVLAKEARNTSDIKAIKEEIFELKSRLKTTMDKGLPPDKIKPLKGLLAACEAAGQVVDSIVGSA